MSDWPLWALVLAAFGVLALSVGAFAISLAMTWPHTKAAVLHLVGWFRSLPERLRESRDPVLRKRRQLTDRYQVIVVTLLVTRQAVRNDADPETLRAFEAGKDALASFFSGLTDADLESLSAFVAEGPLQGKAPLEEVREFMREERSLVVSTPYLAPKHLDRMVQRFHHRFHPEEGP